VQKLKCKSTTRVIFFLQIYSATRRVRRETSAAIITLLSDRCHTVVTLLLHCSYTIVALLFENRADLGFFAEI
jgi:hypothetical protein